MRKIKVRFSEIVCVLFLLLSIFLYIKLLSAQIRNISLESDAKVMAIKVGIAEAKLNFDKGDKVYYSCDCDLPVEFKKEGFKVKIQGEIRQQYCSEIVKNFFETHNNKLLKLYKSSSKEVTN